MATSAKMRLLLRSNESLLLAKSVGPDSCVPTAALVQQADVANPISPAAGVFSRLRAAFYGLTSISLAARLPSLANGQIAAARRRANAEAGVQRIAKFVENLTASGHEFGSDWRSLGKVEVDVAAPCLNV